MHLSLAYNLRSHKVFVPDDEKPGQPVYSKREQVTYDTSSQTPVCQAGTVEAALEHYNRLHEDEHELVKAADSNCFYFNGPWMHVNFLARLKGSATCVELVPKYFFTELTYDLNHKGFSCVSCVKMDPADPETAPVRGCGICGSRIFNFILPLEDTEVLRLRIMLMLKMKRVLKPLRASLTYGFAKYRNRKNVLLELNVVRCSLTPSSRQIGEQIHVIFSRTMFECVHISLNFIRVISLP